MSYIYVAICLLLCVVDTDAWYNTHWVRHLLGNVHGSLSLQLQSGSVAFCSGCGSNLWLYEFMA